MPSSISTAFLRNCARGIRRFSSASAGTASTWRLPVAAAPSASSLRIESSRLEAEVRRNDTSRAGKSAAPPPSSAPKSSTARWAAMSFEATNSIGRLRAHESAASM